MYSSHVISHYTLLSKFEIRKIKENRKNKPSLLFITLTYMLYLYSLCWLHISESILRKIKRENLPKDNNKYYY